jgi:hypothetical protein
MPRQLLERRYFERWNERRTRLATGAIASWGYRRPPRFIDYWPEVPATIPEKLVFAELVRRQVNFQFSYYLGDLPITPDKRERIRPDFLLPDYNIIIEVFGVYWHSRPGSYEHDLLRAFYLWASGFKVYILLDDAVIANPIEAVDSIPELRAPAIHGSLHLINERPFNPKAAIAARLRKYPRVFAPSYVGPKDMGRVATWTAGVGPLRPKPPIGPILTALPPELIAEAERFGEEFRVWANRFRR